MAGMEQVKSDSQCRDMLHLRLSQLNREGLFMADS